MKKTCSRATPSPAPAVQPAGNPERFLGKAWIGRAAIPEIIIPTIRIPLPNGEILLRPGKPILAEPEIGVTEAAKLLGMSRRWVELECSLGRFKTAHKPGTQRGSRWKIGRAEVLERKAQPPPE